MAKTALQKAYDKEIRRIERFIKNASKRGYTFDRQAIQEMIPERGKRITVQKIQIMKSITPPKLYSKATYREPGTGRIMSGFKGRETERRKAAIKGQLKKEKRIEDYEDIYEWVEDRNGAEPPSYLDVIIDQIEEMYSMSYAPGYSGFVLLMDELIRKYGSLEEVAKIIGKVPEVLDLIYSGILFESDGSSEQRNARNAVVSMIARAAGIDDGDADDLQDKVDDENV